MEIQDVQTVLKAAKYYAGALDGIAGLQTWAAVEAVERARSRDYATPGAAMPEARRLVAAGQATLNQLGHEAGAADGLAGHNTAEAFAAFRYSRQNGAAETIDREPLPARPNFKGIPRQREVADYYGQPGTAEIERQLTTIVLPFDLRIDWNLDQTTRKIRLHQRAAPSLKAALIAVHEHYGMAEMRRLGIDRYAGAYNPRRMRGGTKWSMHAYGCAIDFYARPNGLRMRCPQALFCGADYKAFLDIMERHGWLPAIRLWGADAMHFQRARL